MVFPLAVLLQIMLALAGRMRFVQSGDNVGCLAQALRTFLVAIGGMALWAGQERNNTVTSTTHNRTVLWMLLPNTNGLIDMVCIAVLRGVMMD